MWQRQPGPVYTKGLLYLTACPLPRLNFHLQVADNLPGHTTRELGGIWNFAICVSAHAYTFLVTTNFATL